MVWIDKVLSSSFTDVNNAAIWSWCKVRPLLIKSWLWSNYITIINRCWSWLMDDRYLQMVFIVRRHFGDFISLVLVAFDRHGGRVSSKPGEQCQKALPVESEHHLSRGRTMRLNHVKSRHVCRKNKESMNIIKIHKSNLVFNHQHQIKTIQIHINNPLKKKH